MSPIAITPSEWSGQILEEIFRHTPVGVVLTDLHGTVLDVNEALCAMLGYPREHIVGRPAQSFVHPEEQAETEDFLAQVREADAGSRRAVRRLQTRAGKTIWTSITLSVVRSADDEPIFGIAFVEDITDRRASDDALTRSATLYRDVVQDQTEMIVRWKPDGTRTFVNEAYARYFGLPEKELIGTSFFPLVAKEDVVRIHNEIRSLTPEAPSRTGVHRVILADGSLRWNEWTDRATFDDSGQITVLQSVGRDVTDRVEAMEAVRRSESRHRRMFEDLPIPAWESDWSALVVYIRSLGLRSLDELLVFGAANRNEVAAGIRRVRLLQVNSAALALAGVSSREEFETWLPNAYPPESFEALIRGIAPILFDGVDTHHTEAAMCTATNERREVLIQWGRVRESGSGWFVINNVVDLTERKAQERELRSRQARLEQAEGLAELGNWEVDFEAGTINGSPGYWRIFDGYDGGPLVRPLDAVLALMEPRDAEAARRNLDDLRALGSDSDSQWPKEHRVRIRRKDGVERLLASSVLAERRADGTVRAYGVIQDLTERVRAEEKYRELFQSQPVAVWESDFSEVVALLHRRGITSADQVMAALEADPETIRAILLRRRIISANQHALSLLGVADLESFSARMIDPKTTGGNGPILWRSILAAAFGEIRQTTVEARLTRSDGSVIDAEGILTSIETAPGRILVAAMDVTERKQIERDLLHSQLLLERAQAIAHLGSWEISIENDELFGSREYWNIIDGHERGPRSRKLSEALLRVHPDDRDFVWQRISSAHDTFVSGTGNGETIAEFRVVREDNSIRVIRGQGVFTRTATGDVRGYGIAQDITELKKAEETARRQREELMHADRMISLGVLVSGVAHEINNPNQYIMLNVPLLRDAWRDATPILDEYARSNPGLRLAGMPWTDMRQELPEIVGEIDHGAERIRLIVSQLRGFGRDQDRGEFRNSSLNDIIKGSLRLLSNHIRKATTNFSADLGSNLPLIAANPARLEQVVVNLVLNSCQALTRTDAAIRITTSHDSAANAVVMKVVDEGRGIAPADLNKIRDPFFTTKRAEGGTGLGLAVSDRIVQEHNGVLSFESEPGRGTTATLSLPAVTHQEP